jgi:nucleotide-binding universal stress UspA family protein
MTAVQASAQGRRLVIGYDGSEAAAVAINDLARAGLPEVGAAVVISVADATAVAPAAYQPVIAGSSGFAEYGWIGPIEWQRLLDEAKDRAVKEASTGASLVKAALPGWDITADHAIDTAYRAIIERAQRSRADLIVLGSHGRSAVGRLVFGSTSQAVLTYAACSVRVGRASKASAGAPLRLLVGVDGSPASMAAVREVARRRWPAGTECRLLMAADLHLVAALRKQHEGAGEQRGTSPARVLDAAKRIHDESSLKTSPMLVEGDPKHVLVDEAARWGADAVFLGAAGHSRVERFLLGSVSTAVAARASCSVEVIRPAQANF